MNKKIPTPESSLASPFTNQPAVSSTHPAEADPQTTTDWRLVILAGLFIVAAIGCGYFYWQYHKASTTPAEVASQEVTATLAALGNVMVVPNDPNAQVATVLDSSKLNNLTLFRRAANGDKVILLPSIDEVILYRPSEGKIVDIGQITAPPTPDTNTAPVVSASTTVSTTP